MALPPYHPPLHKYPSRNTMPLDGCQFTLMNSSNLVGLMKPFKTGKITEHSVQSVNYHRLEGLSLSILRQRHPYRCVWLQLK